MKKSKTITGTDMENFMNQGWPEPGLDWCLTEDSPIDTDLDILPSRQFKARFPHARYKKSLFQFRVGYQGDNPKNDPTKGEGYILIDLIENFLSKESTATFQRPSSTRTASNGTSPIILKPSN